METFVITTIVVIVLLINIGLILFRNSAEGNLEKWARKNNYKIIEAQEGSGRDSPFSFFQRSQGQKFFYVKVQNENGEICNGWVKASGSFSPVFAAYAVVIWDDNLLTKLRTGSNQ